jgi:L-alanine-DL-glutamate epimerase-like enolase superfamily enzyme
MLELDQSENPWRTEIVQEPLPFNDGFVAVPARPGLGIDVNEEAVRRYDVG